jgi:glycine dehydrogenase subunit 1
VIDVVSTYLKFREFKVELIDMEHYKSSLEDLNNKIDKNAVGILIQSPNRYGYLEDVEAVTALAKDNKALSIMYTDPSSLAILKTPGELGVDIAVGEMQQFGNAMNYGGPHIGYIATTKKLMRKLPGRIAGQATDRKGNRAYVLTLQAREQHIRRDKASSNICSNQALNALSSTIYMSLLGAKGLRSVAINSAAKAHYLYDALLKTDIFESVTNESFYREFVLKSSVAPDQLNDHLGEHGILNLKVISESECLVQFSVTENRTKEELDYLVKVMEGLK